MVQVVTARFWSELTQDAKRFYLSEVIRDLGVSPFTTEYLKELVEENTGPWINFKLSSIVRILQDDGRFVFHCGQETWCLKSYVKVDKNFRLRSKA